MNKINSFLMTSLYLQAMFPTGERFPTKAGRQIPPKRICNIPKNTGLKCSHCRSRKVINGICKSCGRAVINTPNALNHLKHFHQEDPDPETPHETEMPV